jgi:hypothetical protein
MLGLNLEMRTKKSAPKATTPKYKPTAHEESVIRKLAPRVAGSAPRLKVLDQNGVPKISPDHPDRAVGQMLLMEALGTTDLDFFGGFIAQLANAGAQGRKIDEDMLNFMLSVVKGINPNDQTEAMLAAQMAAIHAATMTFARRLAHVENIPQQDSAERALNKLARTFASQMEALKRYRTGGEQKVTVQHVSVQEGGQAIVGNVTQAPSENAANKPPVSPPALTDSRAVPMAILGKPARTASVVRRKAKR